MKALRFEGNGFEYFKIWIVNILLTILTLGLYYPWAKVRNYRYFYANTTLEGRNFEYHATGKQLFFGYLIAMSLLIVYVVIQNFSPVGSLILLLAFFIFFPWVIWRSLMFSLRMTSFSNVRFSFTGDLPGAYFSFLLVPIFLGLAIYALPVGLAVYASKMSSGASVWLIVIGAIVSIVLGIYAFGLMKKVNSSYVISGYRYGQVQFSTELQVREFVKIVLKATGLSLLLFVATLLIVSGIAVALSINVESLLVLQQALSNPEEMGPEAGALIGMLMKLIIPLYLGLIIASMLIFGYFYARQREYILANSKLGDDVTFASTVKASTFSWISISNLFLIIITVGLAFPWAKVRMTRYLLANTHTDTQTGFDQYMTERLEEQSSLGDQIGDAFDVDVGIGF